MCIQAQTYLTFGWYISTYLKTIRDQLRTLLTRKKENLQSTCINTRKLNIALKKQCISQNLL